MNYDNDDDDDNVIISVILIQRVLYVGEPRATHEYGLVVPRDS